MLIFGALLFIQSHRLFYLLREKFQEIAKEKIPCAFQSFATPEKLFFFFKKTYFPLLKTDAKIWKMREHVKILTFVYFVIPLGVIVVALLGSCQQNDCKKIA